MMYIATLIRIATTVRSQAIAVVQTVAVCTVAVLTEHAILAAARIATQATRLVHITQRVAAWEVADKQLQLKDADLSVLHPLNFIHWLLIII